MYTHILFAKKISPLKLHQHSTQSSSEASLLIRSGAWRAKTSPLQLPVFENCSFCRSSSKSEKGSASNGTWRGFRHWSSTSAHLLRAISWWIWAKTLPTVLPSKTLIRMLGLFPEIRTILGSWKKRVWSIAANGLEFPGISLYPKIVLSETWQPPAKSTWWKFQNARDTSHLQKKSTDF